MVHPTPKHKKPRTIVGFSLPPRLAQEVKAEAAGRDLSLKDLFLEIWEHYKRTKTGGQ